MHINVSYMLYMIIPSYLRLPTTVSCDITRLMGEGGGEGEAMDVDADVDVEAEVGDVGDVAVGGEVKGSARLLL